jgi:hypothetical protein
MPPTLTFLHTSPAHIETFDTLLKERAPEIPAAHIVGADFLAEARTQGISPDLTRRIQNQILAAVADGANHEGYVREIADSLRQNAHRGAVILLAQASMAAAATRCTDLPIPVLGSPELGVEAAIAAYRQV